MHRAVGLVVTNPARTHFFLQQKDEHYEPHPLGYSFFGGSVEDGEGLDEALHRELHEELGSLARTLIDVGPRHVLTRRMKTFEFALYEVVLPSIALLDGVPVLEGKRGAVVPRSEIGDLPFIWDLDQVMQSYLESYLESVP